MTGGPVQAATRDSENTEQKRGQRCEVPFITEIPVFTQNDPSTRRNSCNKTPPLHRRLQKEGGGMDIDVSA